MNLRKVPIIGYLIHLMMNDVFMQGLAFIGFSILAAIFGDGLKTYQDLIVHGLFVLGAGMAAGSRLVTILAPFMNTHATELSQIGGKGIDLFEKLSGIDLPDEWERAFIARLYDFFLTVKPEKLEAILQEVQAKKAVKG